MTPTKKKAYLCSLMYKVWKRFLTFATGSVGRWVVPALLIIALCASAVVVTSRQHKVTRMGFQNVGKLTTQSVLYSEVEVLDKDRKIGSWSVPLTQSKYIFSYDGVIEAGYNFSDIILQEDLVAKVITVTLPPPIITGRSLDPDSLVIYDERANIFTPLVLDDIASSQSEMLQNAEDRAIESGLFDRARENVETLLNGFLAALYDPEVYTFVFEGGVIE